MPITFRSWREIGQAVVVMIAIGVAFQAGVELYKTASSKIRLSIADRGRAVA